MPRNYSTVVSYAARFEAEPFGRPYWKCGEWVGGRTETLAVSTLHRHFVGDGWAELPTFDYLRLPESWRRKVEAEHAIVLHRALPGEPRIGHIIVIRQGRDKFVI